MFDTMKITKALGAVCGSLLVFLLLGWAGSSLYTLGVPAHGDEPAAQAYTIEIASAEPAAEEPAADAPAADAAAGEEAAPAADAAAGSFADLVAAADIAKGEKVFTKCKACHKVDGKDITGPHLNGVVDRGIASVEGFKYSDAMLAHAGKPWTLDELSLWLENPKAYAPGNKMSFAGVPKVEDRANLIAYLASLQ